MSKSKFQDVFPGMKISKDERPNKDVPRPPSGRFWTEAERDRYYENLRKDYPSWRNDTIKLLYEKKIITISQHTIHHDHLEEKLYNGFKNGFTPNEFVLNNPKLND